MSVQKLVQALVFAPRPLTLAATLEPEEFQAWWDEMVLPALEPFLKTCPHCENREYQDGSDPNQQVRAFCPVCQRTGKVIDTKLWDAAPKLLEVVKSGFLLADDSINLEIIEPTDKHFGSDEAVEDFREKARSVLEDLDTLELE